ncbi:hypothetical protein [Streptomyces syringium]|uniref:hypothetical protein n=1 Tax=Streptomyces syringium TaxID=76729 RepID=UPI0037D4E6FF
MAEIHVLTHQMPTLHAVAKEIAVCTTYEELCDPTAREHLTLTLASDPAAQHGLDTAQMSLIQMVRTALTDAAAAVQPAFGPGSRYRFVLEILIGTPLGNRIQFAASRTELLTD